MGIEQLDQERERAHLAWDDDPSGYRSAEWEQDGFTMRAQMRPDEISDGEDYLGRLAWDTEDPRRIRFGNLGLESEFRDAARWQSWGYASEYPRGFIPAQDYADVTEDERREYWRQDALRLLGILSQDWEYIGVASPAAGAVAALLTACAAVSAPGSRRGSW